MRHRGKKPKSGKFEQVRGTISVHPNGYAFMQPEGEGAEEVFIPPSCRGSAMPGDTVLVKLRPGRPKQGHREGAVVKIIERKLSELFGFYNGTYVVPRDERILSWFFVPAGKRMKAVAGELVRARIISYPSPSGQAEAEIVEILGKELTPKLESRIILRQYGFQEEFSAKVVQELGSIPSAVATSDFAGRTDLTTLPLVTIDPVDAKDFDDAVCAKKFDWGFRLWVAIADVSRYVQPETEIDRQAYRSATSVYLPDRAVPMLPEQISAGVASLKPDQNRLAVAAEIDYDSAGKPQRKKFYLAVIKSRFRMNYSEVQSILDRSDPEAAAKYQPVIPMIEEMAELARLLHQARQRRGAVDLDLPEARIQLDESGEPVDIYPYPRLFSHQLVEEFMLQANQAVAEFLTNKKFQFPFRIHEQPAADKVQELDTFLSGLGFPLLARDRSAVQVRPRDFQRLVDRASKTALSNLISYLALRSMAQAKYSPANKGHFGLALDHYCHFTSPIRRYPDLMVHRILKQGLGIQGRGPSAPEELSLACDHCSEQERAASDAEREMAKIYQARLMSHNLGRQFEGCISGMIDAGIFVEIDRPMAEGLIPAAKLPGFEHEPKLHTAFVQSPRMELHLGDRVLVEVESVNLEHHEINFRLIGITESGFTKPAKSLLPEPRRKKEPGRRKSERKNFRTSKAMHTRPR